MFRLFRRHPVLVPVVVPVVHTVEVGSFAHGACGDCDWRGPARRARTTAEIDARNHADTCPATTLIPA